MAHVSVLMEEMPIEVLEFEPINPLLSKCQIKVCYVGDEPNRNKSIITKEVARTFAASIPGSPIVGEYNETKEDFESHNRIIEIKDGHFKIKDTTRPYGFVPTDAKVWFQWFEDDGVPHEYLCTEGIIWTGQYPESQRIIDKGNNHSMELDEETLDAVWTKDNNGKPQFFIINEAIMSKLCILGEDVEPCFEGATISQVQFSFEDDYKNKLFSFMEKMQEILSNEGGTTPVLTNYAVEIGDGLWSAIYEWLWANHRECECDLGIQGIYEDGDQKFVILRSRKSLKYFRLNFSITEEGGFAAEGDLEPVAPDFKPVDSVFAAADVEAFEAKFMAEHQKPAEKEPVVEEKPVVEETPVAEEPVVEEPAAEEPVVEEPVAEESAVAEYAAVEEPVAEEKPAAVEEKPVVEEEPVVEPAVEEPAENEESSVAYNLDEVVEYQELLSKYAELESKVQKLNTTIENLTAENKTLTTFKLEIDREKKLNLINTTFYMLSDDQKKDCLDNIDTYSYDDIEAKLSVICVRNRVSFDLNKPEEESVAVLNLDNVVEDEDAGLPAWVKRVKEVEKQNNL